MPRTVSAKKSHRVTLAKTVVNKRRKAMIKAAIKNVEKVEDLNKAASMIDKGVKWGIYHKNKAARLKSKFARKVAAAATVTEEKPEKVIKAKTVAKPKTATKKTVKKAK